VDTVSATGQSSSRAQTRNRNWLGAGQDSLDIDELARARRVEEPPEGEVLADQRAERRRRLAEADLAWQLEWPLAPDSVPFPSAG
jgi:hypothetical protein